MVNRNPYKASPRYLRMKEKRPGLKHELLKQSLDRLRAHLEWQSLKDSERSSGYPPVLLMDPNLAADIRNEQCQFVRAERELRDALNTTIWISGRDRQRYPWFE